MTIVNRIIGFFRLHPDAWRAIRSRTYGSFLTVAAMLLAIPENRGLVERFWDTNIGGHHVAGIVLPGGVAAVTFLLRIIGANRGDPRNTYLTGGADITNPLPAVDAKQAQIAVSEGGTSGPVEAGQIPPELFFSPDPTAPIVPR